MEARAAEIFGEADVNGDGVLNAAEYETFRQLEDADAELEGKWIDERPGHSAKIYAIANKINPNREGVSLEEVK